MKDFLKKNQNNYARRLWQLARYSFGGKDLKIGFLKPIFKSLPPKSNLPSLRSKRKNSSF